MFRGENGKMKTQHDVNTNQYQDKSEAYLHSQVHAQGVEFAKMRELLQKNSFKKVLDLGCGGGHVSYQVAPIVEEVVAYDVTQSMVETVLKHAKQQGLNHVTGQVGCAEHLNFAPQSFDCIISRYSAHHWQNVGQAMLEMKRVLSEQGKVIIFDILGQSDPILDTFLQSIEMIRDPSHVRDYSLQEWCNFAEYAGFRIETIEKQKLELDFSSWITRMQSPDHAAETILYLQSKVSDRVRKYFDIQADGSFCSEAVYLVLGQA
ncbi:SAM-dependent methyltransferase YafE [Acinetobacter gerneri DSM 14967 = CIP 107464 = MTCC 9824]|jgi:ubiquinone/menaquinone biosynthesis C-methylase UbiE|uniref:Methyltransferase type 11 domain-containing protein n=1 Tax=Acinetobacter gerneri DSM 14967 = CIP 107464 = MTCC 9824 TaxID=1120926 RepID=N8YDM8_9GAMM|nr:hypothetical protein F960_00878 [Acinetobacter gerneri DSM 14967 = CIP 107464 = MTCC 9824]EPR81514.1 SAM-dependent methyltransferase YafE [Acinetobacter gerneri DSM 14967 = CIP 107464 = MTCC 9824]